MTAELASKVLALVASLAVALGATWWLTRHERRRVPRAFIAGYPDREFPRVGDLHVSLASLCASQASLLGLYRRLPSTDPVRATVLVFLEELRALMDGAYELAILPESLATRARLQRLAQDAVDAVREMIETAERQLSEASQRGVGDELELRVEVLRALARDTDAT